MSSENFDRKIREKLVRHIPKYDAGSWDNFRKLLPAPWYVKLFKEYGGWLFGGLATTALLVTTLYQTKKTEELNDKIFTLTEQLLQMETSVADTLYIQNSTTDTVYITRHVPAAVKEKIIYLPSPGKQDLSLAAQATSRSLPVESRVNDRENIVPEKRDSEARQTAREISGNNMTNPPGNEQALKEGSGKPNATDHSGALNERQTGNDNEWPTENNTEKQASASARAYEKNLNTSEKEAAEIPGNLAAPPAADQKPEERENPEAVPKKKIKWPRTRLGLSSDMLGFKTLVTGPALEVFLSDKFSFNTGVLFSGQQEAKHPRTMDFNLTTGKRFEEEYQPFIKENLPVIKDIVIQTSFVKMPLYFNYYINTWSRFNVFISAGTKLDLSVYQDVDYVGVSPGTMVTRRFEARPTPKVFNSFFYATGLQYKYRKFVVQASPYFDFQLRRPDYYTSPRNVGINGSLKFEF